MRSILTLTILSIVGASCQLNPSPPRATAAADALLLEVSPSEQQRIASARENCDRANDAYAAAKARATSARDSQISADLDLEAATARVVRAETALEHRRTTGTTGAIDIAKRDLAQAKAEHTDLTAAATLRARQTDHARALAEIAKEHVTVNEALVELAKARAVNTLDRPDGQKPGLQRFEESVRRAEADENLARTRADATQKEIDILIASSARASWSAR